MSRSRLALKLSITKIVDTLNDDGCLDVIRLLQAELKHETLNRAVTQIILQCMQSLSHDSLIKIANTMEDKNLQHRKTKSKAIVIKHKHKHNHHRENENVLNIRKQEN